MIRMAIEDRLTYKGHMRRQSNLAGILSRRIREWFDAQHDALSAEFGAYRDVWPHVSDEDIDASIANALARTRSSFADDFANALAIAYARGAVAAQRDLGVTFSAEVELDQRFDVGSGNLALDYASANAGEKITGIDETTRQRVREEITSAVADGRGYGQLSVDLRKIYNGWNRARAQMIAVYEVGAAYGNGQRSQALAIVAAGFAVRKRRITAGDSRVRPAHVIDGSRWIGVDDAYSDGTMISPATPNCRCADAYERVAQDEG